MPVGVYRRVILTSKWAIKFPRLKNLFSGARCNRWESEIWLKWRPKFGWEHLCPVRFCDPFGIILIMDKATQPVTFDEIVLVNDRDYDNYYPAVDLEYKPENWGIVEGKMVCVDYGIDESELVIKKREYFEERSG
jgi:hypothetical protein